MVTDDVFAVIAEATRRDILVSLQKGDKAVGELVEELAASQPTISKHLKVLREADLVSMRAQGQKRYYALNTKPLEGVATWLGTFDVGRAASVAGSPDSSRTPAGDEQQRTNVRHQAGTSARAGAAAAPGAAASGTPASGTPASRPSGTDLPEAFAAAGSAGRGETGRSVGGELSPAVVVPGGQVAGNPAQDDTVPQQIGRTVGRGAKKAADLLANLPKFGRKK
ncbi:ArsR/SmtB family transcription factor [Arthrobacter sp. NPDC093125]|uniref:ArsR/SmtB family transcription factor n=1 Tax=Arthrobacter sp. NPDC093125 TaxID=3363944 RepID=UPI00381026FF